MLHYLNVGKLFFEWWLTFWLFSFWIWQIVTSFGKDTTTDGKWCYIVFWVVGEPNTSWNLLKKRLSEICPSHFSTCGIDYHTPDELQQSRPLDVFLLKFWCSYDGNGLLHGKISFSYLLLVSWECDLDKQIVLKIGSFGSLFKFPNNGTIF